MFAFGLNGVMDVTIRRTPGLEMAVGLILLFGPRPVLTVVATQAWEVDLLRYVGLLTVLLGLQWGWVTRTGDTVLRTARWRVAPAIVLLALYVFTQTGLFLILGFSMLIAANLAIGLERAFAYSEALRSQLDPTGRPPR